MTITIDPIEQGESGLSVRQKLNTLIEGATYGWFGVVTPEDLEELIDLVPPARPTGLTLTSVAEPEPLLTATWNFSPEEDFAYYDLQIKERDGNFVGFTTAVPHHEFKGVQPNTPIKAQVRAFDKSGNASEFSDLASHTTAKDTIPPAMPIGLNLRSGLGTFWLEWIPNTESDLARYEIYFSDVETSPPAEATGTYDSVAATFNITGLENEVTRHFWVRAVDTSGNKSPWSARKSGTTTSIPPDIQITVDGILFKQNDGATNRLTWSAGYVIYGVPGENPIQQPVSAGSADWTSGSIYVYYIQGDNKLLATSSVVAIYGSSGVILGIYRGGTDFQLVEGDAFLDGGKVLAQTIGANQLVTGQAVITGTAQIAAAIINDAHIISLMASKITVPAMGGLDPSIRVGNTGITMGALTDPAALANAGTTLIQPGKIVISGSTTLADWRMAGDVTRINGGLISTNTIKANSLEIGSRNITLAGIVFEHNKPANNQVSWTAGSISYINDAGAVSSRAIPASAATWTSGTLYIYWAKDSLAFSATTSAGTAFASDNVVIATYRGGIDLDPDYGRTIVDGAAIKTGTITATQANIGSLRTAILVSDVIVAGMIAANAVAAGNVAANVITSREINVTSLSAISANIGIATAGMLRSSDSMMQVDLNNKRVLIADDT